VTNKSFFRKIQNLSDFQKKVIIYIVIFILAVPLVAFVFNNFQKNIRELRERNVLEKLRIQEAKEKKEEIERGLKEETNQIQQKIKEDFSTSITSESD